MKFVNREMAQQVAAQGADYLRRCVNPDGRFTYWRFNAPNPGIVQRYNALRHFGAIWSMYEVAGWCKNAEAIHSAGRLALRYGVENFVKPFGTPEILCVVDGSKVKLGGAGLAIIAIAAAAEAGEEAGKSIALALGRYLLSQANGDGTFIHTRAYPIGVQVPFVSNYYTGQALFALLRLTDLTAEETWAKSAVGMLQKLAKSYVSRTEDSHWMLYAIELAARHGAPAEVRRLGGRIAQSMLESTETRDQRHNTTSLACSTEGLSAWLRMRAVYPAEPDDPEPEMVQRRIRMNLTAMLKARNEDGSFVSMVGKSDVRIDYVQHCIAAFLAYCRQSESNKSAQPSNA